ncbi:hypothetical protein CBP51_20015 [Cellvibrio mixtus]|uniref:Uncharacterized protein n=1 Tax=Cellvibrio mixtus TaxID=39650 RepID=A0A266Q1E6_9GAMM|nr:hypothetical protein B0D95_17340 [Cellvibrio sp. PSBB023]OZY83682.1 hypothetical protein CBP51_20015 [Cellvibrio mixtus]
MLFATIAIPSAFCSLREALHTPGKTQWAAFFAVSHAEQVPTKMNTICAAGSLQETKWCTVAAPFGQDF